MNAIQSIVSSALRDVERAGEKRITYFLSGDGELSIERIESGPNGLPAFAFSFLDSQSLFPSLIEMRFEITDLGYFPYYLRNDFQSFVGSVYSFDRKGNITSIDHAMKRTLMEVAEDWDRQLLDYGLENLLPAAGGDL